MSISTFGGSEATVRRVARLALWAAFASFIAACGGGGSGGGGAVVAPTLTTQPADQSVTVGSAATFSVVATGTAPLAYQWSSSPDGTTYAAIAGATGASYGTGGTSPGQDGARYRVAVSNAAGSVTSNAARLTVTGSVVAPAIVVQPADQTVSAPSTATFNVTATGTALSYEWQFSSDGGATYSVIGGVANAPTYSTLTAVSLSGTRYRVRVNNGAGSVLSAAALLTVTPTPSAPTFTTQPAASTILAGQTASFTVAAAGTPAPSFQWRLNAATLTDGAQAAGPCSGSTVGGAATATLTLTTVPIGCSGAVFSAIASNGVAPNATSNGATLTVNAAPIGPVITAQPGNQTVLTDATATFSVTATGNNLSYQWKKNGTTIVGATAASYTTPAVTWTDSGATYTVVVSNPAGNATSNAAVLNLMLSADQQAFESVILTVGGSHQLTWNLNYSGPETSGINYAYSDSAKLTVSPLTNGPQTATQTPRVNLTTTLAVPPPSPFRVLKNGVILVVPGEQQVLSSTYVGSSIRVDSYAADGTTLAYSQIRRNYTFVALTGPVKSTTGDMAHYLNSFYSNVAILNGTVVYPAGAGYIKYDAFLNGDRYAVFDCGAVTTDANVSPCFTGTTLASALTSGITSASDGVTYHTADGAMLTLNGVPVWVATAPRPQASTLTASIQYRFYFELNGNVYAGSLIKDGEEYNGSYYVSNPGGATVLDRLTFLPFSIRLNKAARDGIAAAMAI